MRPRLLAASDGIPDGNDEMLSCGLAKTPSYAPATPAADRLALQGEKVLHAVTAANGVMGYNPKLGPRRARCRRLGRSRSGAPHAGLPHRHACMGGGWECHGRAAAAR